MLCYYPVYPEVFFCLKQEENQYKLTHFYPVTANVTSLSTSATGAASFSPKTDPTALFRAASAFSLFFVTFPALSAFRVSFRPFILRAELGPECVLRDVFSPSSRRAHILHLRARALQRSSDASCLTFQSMEGPISSSSIGDIRPPDF
jgi:hypothetical protein